MSSSIQCLPCPVISAQRDFLGHNVNQCNQCQNIQAQFGKKWRRFAQERPRRLVRGINRRLRKRVGSTRY